MRVGLKTATVALAATLAAALVGVTVSAFSSTTQSAANTFATAASFGSCPDTTVTSGFVSGFETGRSGYSAGLVQTSVPAVVDGTAGTARTGAYSLKVHTSGTTGYGSYQTNSVPFPSVQVMHVAFRLDSQPATNAQILTVAGGSGSVVVSYVQGSGVLSLAIRRDATTAPSVVTGTTPVTAGTWHVLELRYDVSGTPHTAEWRVDGTAQPTGSTPAGTTTIGFTYLGTRAAETVQVRYDDLLISKIAADYPLGDGRVYAIRPNAMGTSVNPTHFLDDDGTAIDATTWQRLDEAPMDSMTDHIHQATVNPASYAELAFENTTQTCIRAANSTFSTHTTGNNQSNDLKLSVFDGAAESVIREGSMNANTGVSRNYGNMLVPATSWSQAAINGLVARWGYGADVTPSQWLDSIVVEYEVPQ